MVRTPVTGIIILKFIINMTNKNNDLLNGYSIQDIHSYYIDHGAYQTAKLLGKHPGSINHLASKYGWKRCALYNPTVIRNIMSGQKTILDYPSFTWRCFREVPSKTLPEFLSVYPEYFKSFPKRNVFGRGYKYENYHTLDELLNHLNSIKKTLAPTTLAHLQRANDLLTLWKEAFNWFQKHGNIDHIYPNNGNTGNNANTGNKNLTLNSNAII